METIATQLIRPDGLQRVSVNLTDLRSATAFRITKLKLDKTTSRLLRALPDRPLSRRGFRIRSTPRKRLGSLSHRSPAGRSPCSHSLYCHVDIGKSLGGRLQQLAPTSKLRDPPGAVCVASSHTQVSAGDKSTSLLFFFLSSSSSSAPSVGLLCLVSRIAHLLSASRTPIHAPVFVCVCARVCVCACVCVLRRILLGHPY